MSSVVIPPRVGAESEITLVLAITLKVKGHTLSNLEAKSIIDNMYSEVQSHMTSGDIEDFWAPKNNAWRGRSIEVTGVRLNAGGISTTSYSELVPIT